MPQPPLRSPRRPSTLKSLAPLFLAVLCYASPLGIFDGETSVAATPKPGRAAFNSNSGEYAVAGPGDIGGSSDGFHYVWKRMTGDIVVGADIRFAVGIAGGDRKAALMIRQTLDPRAAYAAAVLRSDGLASFQYRPDEGATSKSTQVAANADLTSTVYVSLERHGDAFTMSAGKRGKRGGPIPFSSPVTVTMNGPVYVGLAASAFDPATQETAVFSNVYLQP
jgi:hypothetical protein